MEKYYTAEKNTQILIALMKAHGVRKIVASPGTTNVCLVGSLQQDPYFEMYSSVDERSAAYIACGLAAESGEPVALSCTGATASRNYVPGLTEAYYRKLPVLAITSTQHTGRVGQLMPQVLDRSNPMNDIAKISVDIPAVHDAEDAWACNTAINKALLELRRHGGGPVHINLATEYSKDFSVKELPAVRVIKRFGYTDKLPELKGARMAVSVGAHLQWNERLTKAVDAFCEKYNGVVLCEHISNYHGKYRVNANLVLSQDQYQSTLSRVDVQIHIGEVSGAYVSPKAKETWRVSPDGEVRDAFKTLKYVFEMEEEHFFERYLSKETETAAGMGYFGEWKQECERIAAKLPELPFSNAWIAARTASRLPEGCVLHLGILNTLRVWNFFELPESVPAYANTGGFGIDGNTSSLIGASLCDKDKLYIGVVGDLSFFYDLNSVGNRHVGRNLRLMIINNGRGTEFRNYNHPAERFGDDADAYMAAAGHYGKQSPELIKHYAEALGFEYMSADNKEDYLKAAARFLKREMTDSPMIFEVFTDSKEESRALEQMRNIEISTTGAAKKVAKDVLGDKGVKTIKKLIGR